MRYLLRYCHGNKKSSEVALTFDDGPSCHTQNILDVLDDFNIKATFFLIPENIEKLPAVAHQIIKKGHEIGGHVAQTNNFSYIKSFFKKVNKNKILLSSKIIKQTLNLDINLFRPSIEIALNRGTEKTLKKFGLLPILASSYSRVHKSIKVQTKEITKKLKGGSIILLHDGNDLLINSPRPKDTMQILPVVIKDALKKHLRFVKVSELLHIEPYKI